MERIREYYEAINDIWKLLKPRLLDDSDPRWDMDEWWDSLMADVRNIYGKFRGGEAQAFAERLATDAALEVQRIKKGIGRRKKT